MTFCASPVLHKKLSSASRSWLSRQSRDRYVKQRNMSPNAYRSRSAFKLLELNAAWGSFLSKKDVRAVVDLGAAPGGWSQVVAEKLGWIDSAPPDPNDSDLAHVGSPLVRENNADVWGSWNSKRGRGVIVSVDLLPIAPIPGVHTLQMDFLTSQAMTAVQAALTTPENPSGMADIILSDMAANFSGYKTRDVESSLDICQSVFDFAKNNLHVRDVSQGTAKHQGGILLLKHFSHPLLQDFRKCSLEPNFHAVHYIKPSSSRTESAEGYWLCRGWKGTNSNGPPRT